VFAVAVCDTHNEELICLDIISIAVRAAIHPFVTMASVSIRPRRKSNLTLSRKRESKTAPTVAVKNRGTKFVAGWNGRLSSFVASPLPPLASERLIHQKGGIRAKNEVRRRNRIPHGCWCNAKHFLSPRNDIEEGILVQRVLNVRACYSVFFVLDFFW
jgi:hypothetical protein